MRIVTGSELSHYKVLPFDLYTEEKGKIFDAGEILTPGKLIMLNNYSKIYTLDTESTKPVNKNEDGSNKSELEILTDFTYESINTSDFETVINKDSCLIPDTQVKIKYFFSKILELFKKGFFSASSIKILSLANVLKNVIYKQSRKTEKGSRVRFMGEYEICHPLNVAMISGLIARKLDVAPRDFEEIIISALLHDVGKFQIKRSSGVPAYITLDEEEIRNHTTIGYKLIKEQFKFSENIALTALEHHENNDGSGYPQGLSSDYISKYSQIINVANYYDNLAFNRTHIIVANNREALRAMLDIGTKTFSAEMLYTFIHMFKYDDLKDFNDMIF